METVSENAPKRMFMEEPGIEWRSGIPKYTMVDKKYLAERTKVHKEGSLEKIVEDLVKKWEMEIEHKMNPEKWQSIDQEKFNVSVNGSEKYHKVDYVTKGGYNLLLHDSPLYDAEKETYDSSHDMFRSVFKTGFAWEVLEVFSDPPTVSFTWRHWGNFDGDYKDIPATGETIEMFGSCVATVNEKLQIEKADLYFDPNSLMGKIIPGKIQSGCPFKQQK